MSVTCEENHLVQAVAEVASLRGVAGLAERGKKRSAMCSGNIERVAGRRRRGVKCCKGLEKWMKDEGGRREDGEKGGARRRWERLNSLDLNLGNLGSGLVGSVVDFSPLDESSSRLAAEEGSSLNGASDGEGGDEDRGEHFGLSRRRRTSGEEEGEKQRKATFKACDTTILVMLVTWEVLRERQGRWWIAQAKVKPRPKAGGKVVSWRKDWGKAKKHTA